MGFSTREYWSGLPCPPPWDLPVPWIKPVSVTSSALAGRFFTTSANWEAHFIVTQLLSCVRLFVTPWTVTCQAPLSMGFCRQENQSGLPCPPPGNLLNPGIKPRSPALQADSLPSESPGKPKYIRVNSLSLLQRIFPTQGLNLHWQVGSLPLGHQGSPRLTLHRGKSHSRVRDSHSGAFGVLR